MQGRGAGQKRKGLFSMKKTMKKLMAALLAAAMVCAMAIPAFAVKGTQPADITNHSFSAYQIFTATVTDNTEYQGKVSNIKWGTGVDKVALLGALQGDSTFAGAFGSATTATDVVKAMSGWSATDAKTAAFAKIVAANLSTVYTTSTSNSIHFTDAGYYLIVDTTPVSGADDAANLTLLNVAEAGSDVTVKSKVVKPTVDKFVWDNNDGANAGTGDGATGEGFYKTADHAIGESFQFELVANLPASTEYNNYSTYEIKFHDTMSKGITYEKVDKVVIIDSSNTETTIPDYVVAGITDNEEGPKSWTVTIANAKSYSVDLTKGATIKVYYSAHLNKDAYVNNASGDTTNKNTVSLEYSNNPNTAGTGKTPEETVYVFTYQINNTKYHDSDAAGNELENAGFKLYTDSACTQEFALKKEGDFYIPTTGTGEEMKSAADGKFNIKGLDAGIYYLKETSTPTSYNTCEPVEIKIVASHSRNASELGYVDLTQSTGLNNKIINLSGTVLPSTGGIGTTIFYVIGGGLMAAAAILLITKKRMENH